MYISQGSPGKPTMLLSWTILKIPETYQKNKNAVICLTMYMQWDNNLKTYMPPIQPVHILLLNIKNYIYNNFMRLPLHLDSVLP